MRLRGYGAGSIVAALLALLAVMAGLSFLVSFETLKVPSFADVRAADRPSDTLLLDRDGRILHEHRVDHSRRRLQWTPLEGVSPALQAAVIASEDRRFEQHAGVDVWAVAAALVGRLGGERRRGASTISMQLTSLLDPELRRRGSRRSWDQKWLQMRRAWAVERAWSKAEILETYLNLVTFRGELQGIAAAARILFGKEPHGLTAAEALVLAALVRAPNADRRDLERRAKALREVRARTEENVSDGELTEAIARAVRGSVPSATRVALAPHVAHRLLRGPETGSAVQSTLRLDVQNTAIDALRRHLLALEAQHVHDGAVLVADVESGEVLAYVGGSGDLSSGRHVDAIRARRQAGSTLKPFLYGLAFDERLLTPASLLEDMPLELPVFGGLYRPENYDDHFLGLVSVRTALASSLNIPAVRTLSLIGVEQFTQRLRQLGFGGIHETGEFYGPSLALGSADVSLWELVSAYRALANGGTLTPLRLEPNEIDETSPRRPLSEAAAFLVSDILADREGRSVTFGLESPLATRFWTAVKTGTSKSMRDNWCIGYSRRFVVGVWVGNLRGDPMRNVSGMSGAAPIWLDVMTWLHREADSAPPVPPENVVGRRVSFPQAVEPSRLEGFIRGTEPPVSTEPILTTPRPRIVTPTNATVIALDPDIPAQRQRVVFEATEGATARWFLDGSDLGTAVPNLWQPRPGAHVLELIGADERVLDVVRFAVRGGNAHAAGVRP